MKIGFTGTQLGMSQHQKEQFVLLLQATGMTEFHHGDCIGADAEAHDIVRAFFPDVKIIGHLPKKTDKQAFKVCDEYRDPLDYLVRDRNIVNETEFLFGAPKKDEEELRSGTWTTIRHARKIKRNHKILKRDEES